MFLVKNAFTMIEIVFTLIIIGIVSAIAVPSLFSTRDDAEILKTISDVKDVIKDVSNYYNTQGDFANSIASMTDVEVSSKIITDDNGLSEAIHTYKGNKEEDLITEGKRCLKIVLLNGKNSATKKIPPYIKVVDGDDINSKICQKLIHNKTIQNLRNSTFIAKRCGTEVDTFSKKDCTDWVNDLVVNGIPLVGINPVY